MIEIRHCEGFDELQACVDLQVEVWGYSDGDVIPRRVFLVAHKIGGQVLAAFEEGSEVRGQGSGTEVQGLGTERQGRGTRDEGLAGGAGAAGAMVGFALSLPGVKTGAQTVDGLPVAYLHSHMLAVRDGYRNQNIGARLKLAQRDDALKRGIALMEWTFDPLEIKNAYLNIHKLGAVVRRYEENFYGSSSSKLQGGVPTDRLVAEWWIASERVAGAVGGGRPEAVAVMREILVPAAIYAWKADDAQRHLALEVQTRNRLAFQAAFAEGLAVVGFVRDAEGNGRFQLGEWAEPASISGHSQQS